MSTQSINFVVNFAGSEDGTSNKSSFVIKPQTTNGPLTPHSASFDSNAVSAATSLILLGKGMGDYGDIIANNFVWLLENFASSIPPVFPTAGQLWYDLTCNAIRVFDGTHWNVSQPIVSDTAPSSQTTIPVGAIWINKSTSDISVFDGTHWNNILNSLQNYVTTSGGTLTGNLNFSNLYTITNIRAPILDNDAVSKIYADGLYNTLLTQKANVTHQHQISDITNLQSTLDNKLSTSGGTVAGNITVSGNITLPTNCYINLTAAPIIPTNAVNKQYVDNQISSAGYATSFSTLKDVGISAPYDGTVITFSSQQNKWVNQTLSQVGIAPLSHVTALSGAHDASAISVTPPLDMVSSNVQSLFDEFITYFVPIRGGTMSGQLNMNNYSIHNVANPSNVGDAVPKIYVDSLCSGQQMVQTLTNATQCTVPPYRYDSTDISVYKDGLLMIPNMPAYQVIDINRSASSLLSATGLTGDSTTYTATATITIPYSIVGLTATTIALRGDLYNLVLWSQSVGITGSTANNGTYNILSSTVPVYDNTTNTTTFTVSTTIPTPTDLTGIATLTINVPVAVIGINSATYGDLISAINNTQYLLETSSSSTSKSFSINGDFTTIFTPNIRFSTVYNYAGTYTVSSSSYSNGVTTIITNEALGSGVDNSSGYITLPSSNLFNIDFYGRNLKITSTNTGTGITLNLINSGSHPLLSSLQQFNAIQPAVNGVSYDYKQSLINSYADSSGSIISNIIEFNAPLTGTIYIKTQTNPQQ